jgi:23S rRNA (adenine2030-N6)-methyltransferase
MLSYQHGYHAGNFADVLKHIVLIKALRYLKQKDKPLCYIETHAGKGLYALTGSQAQKNKEYLNGIGCLWEVSTLPDSAMDYRDLIRTFNLSEQLTCYPGSPKIAEKLLDQHDRIFCFEQHPGEKKALSQILPDKKGRKIICGDGLKEIMGLLPPKERRGLILIDPSYEIKSEYDSIPQAIQQMVKRFATGCYLLWYPVVDRQRTAHLEKLMGKYGFPETFLFELSVKPDAEESGMTACGMILINTPWQFADDMEIILTCLAEKLGEDDDGRYRIKQLS